MSRLYLLLAATCLLSGCAGGGKAPRPAPKAAAAAEAPPPKPQPGLDWHFAEDGTYGRLAYGAANTDDVHLMLSCTQNSGNITMVRSVPADKAGTPPKITLTSGTARGTWLATAAASQLEPGHTDLTATTQSMDPVMQAFARHGWTSVSAGDETEALAPQPGGHAVRQFFRFCG